jgi:gluconate kinase
MADASGALRRVTFVTAWSGVGKTTTGDFLGEYCGVLHLDGDADMREKEHKEKVAATAGLIKAFSEFWFKERAAPADLWHPYFQLLVDRVLATEPEESAGQQYPHVVVSFSVYRREVRDFLRERLSGSNLKLEFLKLECDVDVVVRGAIGRLEDYLKTQDPPRTIVEHWQGPSQASKRHFLRHLYIKCIILPRQARDDHRENSKKVPFSLSSLA